MKTTAKNYVIGVHDDPAAIDRAAWNRLLEQQAEPTVFMRHELLSALHEAGCAVAKTGWAPRFLTLHSAGELAAACVRYEKAHSYGEYVFDWAWAEAYHRHGLSYYPKHLVAVPFTPVPGSRLLAVDGEARRALAKVLREQAKADGRSSVHVLYGDDADFEALRTDGWMVRQGVQFHWQRPVSIDWFEDFLATLNRDKRKKIQQERRRVREAGVRLRALHGAQITEAHWDYFHRCYLGTYRAHHSSPYLNREFFHRMAQELPEHWLMFLAEREGTDEAVGCSLIALDPARRTAYGRYWGCTAAVDCLHFEACYYAPLAWCIENGYERFEGGAQGEHKMARGLMPVVTRSAHWIADPRFASAVEDFLQREGAHVGAYVDELSEHSPFKPRPNGAAPLSGP